MLQKIFGHSSPSITLRYIGNSDDMIDEALDDFFCKNWYMNSRGILGWKQG